MLKSNAEIAQSYDTLLSSLYVMNSTRHIKTIMVTSTQPGEGKTTVVVTMALAMTFGGKKALVIDADLRKPRVHAIMGLQNTGGVADVLNGSYTERTIQMINVEQQKSEKQPTLSVMTTGRVSENSFNILTSPKLKEALEDLKTEYEMVLLDSPPVLSVSDALLLAPLVDGIIMVLNTGIVSQTDALRAKERIEQAGGQILGVVMNRFDEKLHGPGFHPYSSYYSQEPK